MLVEFDSVKNDHREMWQRGVAMEKEGPGSISFHCLRDYIGKIAIEMDDVRDWDGGTMYVNDKQMECVHARYENGDWSKNILISFEDFSEIYAHVTDYPPISYTDALRFKPQYKEEKKKKKKKKKNENNPKDTEVRS